MWNDYNHTLVVPNIKFVYLDASLQEMQQFYPLKIFYISLQREPIFLKLQKTALKKIMLLQVFSFFFLNCGVFMQNIIYFVSF